MRLAIIPARGGSRRIPRKNIRPFHGQPMLTYPIQAAKDSGLFDLIVVSTDDFEIADVAFKHGCAVLPRPFDDGTVGTQEIAARVLDTLDVQAGIACVIYATSPLLLAQDLKDAHSQLQRPYLNKCFAMSVGPDGQDAGCFYFGWVRAFRDRRPLDDYTTSKFVLPAERVCDINTWDDWRAAEAKFDAMRRTA